jgi:hypothetical protein
MNKEDILDEIKSFIYKGDEIIKSINLFIQETNDPKYGGLGSETLLEKVRIIEEEYKGYFKSINTAVKKYSLNEIEESAFKAEVIEEIRGGASVVVNYINIQNSRVILKSVENLIMSTKKELREVAKEINTKSVSPFREIKDDDTAYSFKIKERTFTFNKSTLQYWLIKYMIVGYNENLYYHQGAINYINQNCPERKGRLSSIINNINDSNPGIKFKLIEILKKGTTFKFNDKLFK